MTPQDATRSLRWSIYTLLIVMAAAISSARIFCVAAKDRDPQTPFLSANDRSRWCTIRALVDHGTYVIDDIIFDESGERVRGWHTIDLVRHRGHDGREHYYSSKPVLMPTLMAGVYWLVKQVTGANLADHPFHAGRLVLWLCNIPPLLLMWWLLARIIDRASDNDWARCFVMGAATFGTFLSTFSITLNNHLHAAVCVTVTLYSLLNILQGRSSAASEPVSWWHYSLAGLFAALAFANELPALAFFALVGLATTWCDWRKTMLYFAPPAILVLAAMVGLNYFAHGSWRPPYAHRNDGPVIAVVDLDTMRLRNGNGRELIEHLRDHLPQPVSGDSEIQQRVAVNEGDDITNQYQLWDETTQQRFALQLNEDSVEIRRWDNWYEYEGTYWTAARKQGVDRGEPSRLKYAFHCLLGHHGLFSLTPLWLIAGAGMVMGGSTLIRREQRNDLAWVLAATLMLTVVVLAFYFTRPIQDRNYGGWCNGLRWMMWFIPLYLVALLPALEFLSRSRWGRGLAIAALVMSTFSAWYNPMNPWQHPWLYDYWTYLGWIAY